MFSWLYIRFAVQDRNSQWDCFFNCNTFFVGDWAAMNTRISKNHCNSRGNATCWSQLREDSVSSPYFHASNTASVSPPTLLPPYLLDLYHVCLVYNNNQPSMEPSLNSSFQTRVTSPLRPLTKKTSSYLASRSYLRHCDIALWCCSGNALFSWMKGKVKRSLCLYLFLCWPRDIGETSEFFVSTCSFADHRTLERQANSLFSPRYLLICFVLCLEFLLYT